MDNSKSKMRQLIDLAWKIVDRFMKDNITLYSAQAAYFIVVSLIPFMIVLTPLLSLLIPDNTVGMLSEVVHLLPGKLGDIAEGILSGLFLPPNVPAIVVYVILSLWAASKGIMSIQNGLHGIYHVEQRENYFVRRFRCTLYTLIFVGVIILAFVLLVIGGTLSRYLSQTLSFWGKIAKLVLAFRIGIAFLLFFTVFTLGYRYLTGKLVTVREAMPGVLFTTAGWMVFSGFYAIYIEYFTRYITLYGSLGALALLLLWLYFCLLILMVGAEFNAFLSERRVLKGKPDASVNEGNKELLQPGRWNSYADRSRYYSSWREIPEDKPDPLEWIAPPSPAPDAPTETSSPETESAAENGLKAKPTAADDLGAGAKPASENGHNSKPAAENAPDIEPTISNVLDAGPISANSPEIKPTSKNVPDTEQASVNRLESKQAIGNGNNPQTDEGDANARPGAATPSSLPNEDTLSPYPGSQLESALLQNDSQDKKTGRKSGRRFFRREKDQGA